MIKKTIKKLLVCLILLLTKYPNSRFFKWALARAYEDVDKRKSISVYNEILNSYNNNDNLNNINKIILIHLIAQQYQQLGEGDTALKLCNKILNTKLDDHEESKLEKRLERVKDLRKELLSEKDGSK